MFWVYPGQYSYLSPANLHPLHHWDNYTPDKHNINKLDKELSHVNE